jgi:nucleotide-binding universal stress UspA family protein
MTTRILLAIDDSEFSRAATESIAVHIRPESTSVHVLHVLELDHLVPPAFDFARGADYGPEVAARLENGRKAAQELVSGSARLLQDACFETSTVVREGEPRHAILDYAAEWDCDWIVMGSHGRRGFNRFFMGSVSEAVARHAHCSVHIVRLRDWNRGPTGGTSASAEADATGA